MLTLVHIADLHLGAEYSFLPEEKAAVCRETQFRLLERILDHASDISAEVILIAGDLFDSPSPPAAVAGRAMALLGKARRPVLISPGNHDYLGPKSPYLTMELPENVFVFQSNRLTPYFLHSDTVIWGAAFTSASAFIPLDAPLDPQHLNVLSIHGDLKGTSGYNPVDTAQLAESEFDYAAFGHNHTFSGLHRAGHTVYACTGCTMGLATSDTGDKGFLSGIVDKDGTSLHFHLPNAVRFEEIDIPIGQVTEDRELAELVRDHLPENCERVCATLSLIGERKYEPDLEGLEGALCQIFFHCFVRDRSHARRDPWDYLMRDDLLGAVTRRYRSMMDAAASQIEQARLQRSQGNALAALEGETELPE